MQTRRAVGRVVRDVGVVVVVGGVVSAVWSFVTSSGDDLSAAAVEGLIIGTALAVVGLGSVAVGHFLVHGDPSPPPSLEPEVSSGLLVPEPRGGQSETTTPGSTITLDAPADCRPGR